MLDNSRIDLAKYRVEKAKECLREAEYLFKPEGFSSILNRAYYAIFHAVRAIFAIDGIDRKKHSDVISYFQQNYVKTGIFGKEFSRIVQEAFEVRQESDYEDFFVISKDDVVTQYENATKFVAEVEKYINSII